MTLADRLDALCAQTGGTYTRTVDGDRVRLVLALPSGDVVAGTGDTTGEALEALVQKCATFGVTAHA